MGPRADFACLSPKCAQDGAATVYELPIAATRCPMCGSKRIRRIYTAPHISRGVAKTVDSVAEPAHARLHEGRPKSNGYAMTIPTKQLGQHGVTIGQNNAAGLLGTGTLPPPRPDAHSLVDRTSKLPR